MHVHPYERAWIGVSIVILVVFGLAVAGSSVFLGIQLPGIEDPAAPAAAAPQGMGPKDPWIRELGPGRYEVNLIARTWYYAPGEIRVPAGSTVTFYVQSLDILHGFKILDTTVSTMVIPGQVGKVSYTFSEPGEYLMVCHEYCGAAHHIMHGRVIVEGESAALHDGETGR